jgi:osmoprotectant transport system permease protein
MRSLRYFVNNTGRILGFATQHVVLIGIAILLAVMIWVGIGILVRNNAKAARGVLGVAGLIMSIPSVAVYGILVSVPGLGLSRQSAVAALVLYAMLPIVRNVYVALNGVDPAVLEAAKGMGMSGRKILYRVQLPLALPVILSGVRVAVVMMVGIATLAVFIGERNLGVLIQQGLVRTRSDMIIVGAVIVSAFAVGIDYLFGRLERYLVSPGIRPRNFGKEGSS